MPYFVVSSPGPEPGPSWSVTLGSVTWQHSLQEWTMWPGNEKLSLRLSSSQKHFGWPLLLSCLHAHLALPILPPPPMTPTLPRSWFDSCRGLVFITVGHNVIELLKCQMRTGRLGFAPSSMPVCSLNGEVIQHHILPNLGNGCC